MSNLLAKSRNFILLTAFVEGASVLVVEIAGARALAPYYGTSLKVWTSQITATLLFLALGYGLGGRASRKESAWHLPGVFWAAGLWLALFPYLRVPVLKVSTLIPGIGPGSFLASALLFGLPLMAFGAVSPLLIRRLEQDGQGGAAAGSIFFTNTLGGLAGGWLTALLLIPHLPLRLCLAGTGAVAAIFGGLWLWSSSRRSLPGVAAALLAGILFAAAPRPIRALQRDGQVFQVYESHATEVGLLQVMDLGGYGLTLLLDGITQGGMNRASGLTLYEFTEYQALLSHRFHPAAKRALLMGLGTGLLAKQLSDRGVQVDVAELEPAVESVARRYFGLPDSVQVTIGDARAILNRTTQTYDLIFLDAYAGENVPWYLVTRESMRMARSRLNPGGRMLVNYVTRANGSAGLERMEAVLLDAFGEAKVFTEAPSRETQDLVNVCLVAGTGLTATSIPYPGKAIETVRQRAQALLAQERPARSGGRVGEDAFSDLDYADAELRSQWRKLVLSSLGPEVLGD